MAIGGCDSGSVSTGMSDSASLGPSTRISAGCTVWSQARKQLADRGEWWRTGNRCTLWRGVVPTNFTNTHESCPLSSAHQSHEYIRIVVSSSHNSLPLEFAVSAKVHQQSQPIARCVQIIKDLRAMLICRK